MTGARIERRGQRSRVAVFLHDPVTVRALNDALDIRSSSVLGRHYEYRSRGQPRRAEGAAETRGALRPQPSRPVGRVSSGASAWWTRSLCRRLLESSSSTGRWSSSTGRWSSSAGSWSAGSWSAGSWSAAGSSSGRSWSSAASSCWSSCTPGPGGSTSAVRRLRAGGAGGRAGVRGRARAGLGGRGLGVRGAGRWAGSGAEADGMTRPAREGAPPDLIGSFVRERRPAGEQRSNGSGAERRPASRARRAGSGGSRRSEATCRRRGRRRRRSLRREAPARAGGLRSTPTRPRRSLRPSSRRCGQPDDRHHQHRHLDYIPATCRCCAAATCKCSLALWSSRESHAVATIRGALNIIIPRRAPATGRAEDVERHRAAPMASARALLPASRAPGERLQCRLDPREHVRHAGEVADDVVAVEAQERQQLLDDLRSVWTRTSSSSGSKPVSA